MTTITIKTIKRASGWQGQWEMPWGERLRVTGHATKQEAIDAAKARIKRTYDTRVPGMSSITIEVIGG